jgi:putative SOS response-associated peptidase YedK
MWRPPSRSRPFYPRLAGRPTQGLARFGINLAAPGKKRAPLLNARTDSLQRGAFKSMLARRHCVIPAEGFYEWREEGGNKQPYYFFRHDGKPILFAGIWDFSEVKGETVASFAILTDEPNELVSPYHDRMPLVLDDAATWLDCATALDDVTRVAPDAFRVRRVNRAVNKPTEKNLAAIEAAQQEETAQRAPAKREPPVRAARKR